MTQRLNCLMATSLLILLSAGCASTGDSLENTAKLDGFWCDLTGTPATYYQPPLPANLVPAFPRNCFAGDMEVSDPSVCAAGGTCYQLDTGGWCTVPSVAQPMAMAAFPLQK